MPLVEMMDAGRCEQEAQQQLPPPQRDRFKTALLVLELLAMGDAELSACEAEYGATEVSAFVHLLNRVWENMKAGTSLNENGRLMLCTPFSGLGSRPCFRRRKAAVLELLDDGVDCVADEQAHAALHSLQANLLAWEKEHRRRNRGNNRARIFELMFEFERCRSTLYTLLSNSDIR